MKHSITGTFKIVIVLLISLLLLAGCSTVTPQTPAATATVSTETAATVTKANATSTATATAMATTAATATATAIATITPTATATPPTFNATQLSQYNGQNGNRAYIAVDGKVYDVTDVPQWKNGTHANGRFTAGVDQTEILKQAPHGAEMLNGVPIVGIFQP